LNDEYDMDLKELKSPLPPIDSPKLPLTIGSYKKAAPLKPIKSSNNYIIVGQLDEASNPNPTQGTTTATASEIIMKRRKLNYHKALEPKVQLPFQGRY
jgi:hypothetical protein